MDKPSFEALRIALQDADARVRIEELIPPAVPHILGIGFSGGFLNGQVIHLSPNLNCIIGGRGTGKSTTFEALRCLQGRPSDSSVVDSEVWPAELSLFWEDAAGQQHTLLKLVGEDLANVDDPDGGPVEFAIDSYGQGETARISRRAQTDPLALLDYLDKFVDLGEARAVENAARDDLLGLQGKIEEAEEKVALIPQYERNLATTRQQLKASEKANAGEVIQLQRRLAEEREIQRRIVEDWQAAQAAMTGADIEKKIQALKELAKPGDVVVGAAELQVIIAGVATLETHVADAGKLLKREASVFDAVLKEQIRLWRSKDTEALRVIETKRKELEAQGVRLDMGFISKLAKDEASYKIVLQDIAGSAWHLEAPSDGAKAGAICGPEKALDSTRSCRGAPRRLWAARVGNAADDTLGSDGPPEIRSQWMCARGGKPDSAGDELAHEPGAASYPANREAYGPGAPGSDRETQYTRAHYAGAR
jgi:hypothetical protein